jgi:uncharacterized membrane protein YtjA (UPF0391 family)
MLGVARTIGTTLASSVLALTKWINIMLSWAIAFFVLAIIAAVLGFGGIAGTAAGIAKILFFVFLVLLIVSAVVGAVRGRPPI